MDVEAGQAATRVPRWAVVFVLLGVVGGALVVGGAVWSIGRGVPTVEELREEFAPVILAGDDGALRRLVEARLFWPEVGVIAWASLAAKLLTLIGAWGLGLSGISARTRRPTVATMVGTVLLLAMGTLAALVAQLITAGPISKCSMGGASMVAGALMDSESWPYAIKCLDAAPARRASMLLGGTEAHAIGGMIFGGLSVLVLNWWFGQLVRDEVVGRK